MAMIKARMNEKSRTLYLARALYDAVDDCNIQQVHTLLSQNKANPNVLIPEERMTAFHLAAGHENVAFGKVVTSLFLHNGGDPNVLCDGNRTVLHIAVAWNRSSVVEVLLKSPYITPDLYVKDDDNLNVFNYAIKFNAWESLATLQFYTKHMYTNESNNQICETIQSKYTIIEKEDSIFTKDKTEKSIGGESTFNKSDRLHTSSGYLNSGESIDSSSNLIKHNIVSQKSSYESLLSSTDNSSVDILNENISQEYHYTEQLDDIPSIICFDGSIMSSLESINDDSNDENIENTSFPSKSLLSDSDISEFNELKIENIMNQPKNRCLSINEWMTDISGFSSCLSTDDYFTCPDTDTRSGQHIRQKNERTGIQLEYITDNVSVASSKDSISTSISKLSLGTNNSECIDHGINSSDDYDTDYIRQSLRMYGYPPGPLVPSTKRLYVRKLNKIIKNQTEPKSDSINANIISEGSYSFELTKVLISDDCDTWKKTIKSWSSLEDDIVCNNNGSSFTYLLLDPRITRDLPARADQIHNPIEIWQTFISSIFYIGKGTKSRPNDHMNEAFNCWTKKKNKTMSHKTEYILNIWKQKMGVVCVQVFHHLVQKEAYIREAAMIDAIGLQKLTNEKRGTYFDNTVRWKNSDRCKLGCHLLYRAMLVFLADGERQLQPIDLT